MHEGPQRISKTGTREAAGRHDPLQRARLLQGGNYGIRLENLIIVTPAETLPSGDIAMHGFETLTLVPFDKRLLTSRSADARGTALARRVPRARAAEIGPMVGGETLAWLEKATAPLPHDDKD